MSAFSQPQNLRLDNPSAVAKNSLMHIDAIAEDLRFRERKCGWTCAFFAEFTSLAFRVVALLALNITD